MAQSEASSEITSSEDAKYLPTIRFTCVYCGGQLPPNDTKWHPACHEKAAAHQRAAAVHKPLEVVDGRFVLVRELPVGGMGEVWLAVGREAENTTPIERLINDSVELDKLIEQSPGLVVAIKFMKLFRSGDLQTFETERRTIARFQSENIGRVIQQSLVSSSGEPCLVMEYINGVSLTEYCDRRKLSIEKRLALFLDTCRGVAHAHWRNVEHRDLKPANILVVEEGQGKQRRSIPKVIDFGISSDEQLHRNSWHLPSHSLASPGTIPYASPEQFTNEHQAPQLSDLYNLGQGDVYSLGFILFELLTGVTPLSHEDVTKLRADVPPEKLWKHLSQAPKPSLIECLGRLGNDGLVKAAMCRGCSPRSLQRELGGELQDIVAAATQGDFRRRLSSVGKLIESIEAYLAKRPVPHVRPRTWSYVALKYSQRHSTQVFSLATIFLILLVAGSIYAYQYHEAKNQLRISSRSAHHSAALLLGDKARPKPNEETALALAGDALLSVGQAAIPSQALAYLAKALQDDPSNDAASRYTRSVLAHKRHQIDPVALRQFECGAPVCCVQWGCNDQYLSAACADGTARLWLSDGWRPLDIHKFAAIGIEALLLAPASPTAFLCTDEKVIRLNLQKDHVNDATLLKASRKAGTALAITQANVAWIDRRSDNDHDTLWIYGLADEALQSVALPGRCYVWPTEDHRYTESSMLFSHDGRRLYLVMDGKKGDLLERGKRVLCLENQNGKWLVQLAVSFEGQPSVVSISPNDEMLATVIDGQYVYVWNVAAGNPYEIKDAACLNGTTGVLAFSHDSKRLLCGSGDRVARVIDLDTRRLLTQVKHESFVLSVDFSKDGRQFYTASDDRTAQAWGMDGKAMRGFMRTRGRVKWIRSSSNDQWLAVASEDGSVTVWKSRTPRMQSEVSIPLADASRRAVIDESSATLLIANDAGEVESRRLSDGSVKFSRKILDDSAKIVQLSRMPSSGSIIALSDSGDYTHCDRDLNHQTRCSPANVGKIARIVPFPTGDRLLLENVHGEVWLTHIGAHEATNNEWSHHARWVPQISADGSHMLLAPSPSTVECRSTGETFERRRGPLENGTMIKQAGFANSGKNIIFGGVAVTEPIKQGFLTVCDLAGTTIMQLPHESDINAFDVGDTSELVVTAGEDKKTRLWSLLTRREAIPSLNAKQLQFTAAALNVPENLFAAAEDGKEVRLWDVHTGSPCAIAFEYPDSAKSIQFAPKQGCIIVASDEGVKIWPYPLREDVTPPWAVKLCIAAGGMRVGDGGQLEVVRMEERLQILKSLKTGVPRSDAQLDSDFSWANLLEFYQVQCR